MVTYQAKDGHNVESKNGIVVSLELTLNDDLIQEGIARDVKRNIQDARKQLGCDITKRIDLLVKPMQQSWIDVICTETLADIQDISIADIEFEVKNDYGNSIFVKMCRKQRDRAAEGR